ncbi:dihydrofolate reductase family protein [Agromyces kandeliae]|uniref:Deaminase n=1 Tax=Agromyces kandeliae TaxID=2666141 RepID=A0A6L5R485_9MICO|nr:dihydrofolate reductase family protein [Agromyces kandeliae]MRX43887.1 deaminase [Agromyces kandeliae]
MGRVVYGNQMSLDGYVADREGRFDWAVPGEDVHAAVNDDLRNVGTFVLGRRVWEVLRAWDVMDLADQGDAVRDFAGIWAAADKVVCSRTLAEEDLADAPRTRLSRAFDPDEVRALAAASDRDVAVGGPELASQALASGLVDDVSLHVHPVVVGGGTPAFPTPVLLGLELVEQRGYDGGVVGLRYRPRA